MKEKVGDKCDIGKRKEERCFLFSLPCLEGERGWQLRLFSESD